MVGVAGLGQLDDAIEALAVGAGVEVRAPGGAIREVGLLKEHLAPQLHAVVAARRRDVINETLQREACLRDAVTPVGPRRGLVRHDRGDADRGCFDPVGAGHVA